MILSAFTLFHVLVSLVGIGSGFAVMYGLFTSKRFDAWTATFLTMTAATSVTGFLFPVHRFVPSLFQKVGPLKALAPTQSEPPFQITQLVVLLLFALADNSRRDQGPQRVAPHSLNRKQITVVTIVGCITVPKLDHLKSLDHL